MASNTTQDLMASLMGGGDGPSPSAVNGDQGGESDLFGNIPIVDPVVSPPAPAEQEPKPQGQSNGHAVPTAGIQDPSLIVPPNDPLAAQPAAANDPLTLAANPAVATSSAVPATPTIAPEASNPTGGPSLLMQSGLLGDTPSAPVSAPSATASSDGGLFASVDQEEAERAQAEATEIERQRLEAEQRRIALEKQKELEQQQKQLEQQKQQQQLQDQMQSVYLGNGPPQNQPPPPQQQQHQNPNMMQQSNMIGTVGNPPGAPSSIPSQPGYLSSPAPPHATQQPAQAHPPLSNGAPANNMDNFYRADPAHSQQPGFSGQGSMMQPPQQGGDADRYYHPSQNPVAMAGMHNVSQSKSLGQAPRLKVVKPDEVNTFYDKVVISEPLLVAQQKGLLGSLTGQSNPHWSYQITTYFKPPPNQSEQQQQHAQFWVVRRRFRHVVALEDRLHDEIPGAILPPRPDKHATRALEEASTQQSAEFALQRAAELQVYMNQLIQHPYAYNTHTLRLFLSLQDDLGTAWPEVSNNAFTRLANASVGAAVKVSEQTQATKFPWQDPMGQIDDYGEDNAELLALSNQEQMRMASVLQSVPKLEGAITLVREGAERMGSTGMELSRLSKEVAGTDMALSQPMDIVSSGMLRSGRRNKRLALELFAALHSYSQHYKTCRYEKQAFMDRRLAIMRRHKERGRVDQRASALYQQQQQQQMYQQPYGAPPPQQPGAFQPSHAPYQQQPYGNAPGMNPYQNPAGMADNAATDAWQDCDEIGQRLRSEINRLAYSRRTDWLNAVKVVASSYKEATTENVAIWQAVQESYLQAFPQYEDEVQRQPAPGPAPSESQGIPQEQQVPP